MEIKKQTYNTLCMMRDNKIRGEIILDSSIFII